MILSLHDPEWASCFRQLRDLICARLGIPPSMVHHVGSTSIPGLIAKPIIDIDIEIPDYGALPGISAGLEELGYINEGEKGIKDRIAFGRRDAMVPYGTPRRGWLDHHLYVCPSFSRELARHLAFKDALLKNPAERARYAEIKLALEREACGDRKKYAEMKETRARAFVDGLIEGM